MLRLSLLLLALNVSAYAQEEADEGYRPPIEPASDEGALAMARFELAEGFEVNLWAAEPLLANPVCFAIDSVGRVFVAETFRLHAGVTDMRQHQDWLDEDLASRTVAERIAMMARHEGELTAGYGTEHDRVRLLVDTDGDGKADQDTVFADGFLDPAAGIAAGLLPHEGGVYYTCIPDLWKLVDADGDGVAEARESLHTGFGVNIALLGHDMHGLRIGPDGMLYFSIGDRGFHVETGGPSGTETFAHPHAGAVLRCELDGSNLEIYATGLRNPQELVFDDQGNLFTGDNNSDGGDKARWVYVLEGGDSGWRYPYQWITQPNLRGPWNAEKQWHPPHEGQPAFLNPPITNFTSGPSGLAYYPGGAIWDYAWERTFFLCDFRGNPSSSGIHSFKNKAKGAGFELVEAQKFLWNSLATDVDFGPDGALYVSDWVAGWNMTGKGRIYRVTPEGFADNWRAQDVQKLLAAGMRGRTPTELGTLLNHDHRDVRQGAQFELVRLAREEGSDAAQSTLHAMAVNRQRSSFQRLHGVWGIAQLVRTDPTRAELAKQLPALLDDLDHELRAQTAKAIGHLRYAEATPRLVAALEDRAPRVRMYAAEALGRLGVQRAVGPILAMLERNGDKDPWLRHAGVWALVSIGDRDAVLRQAEHASPAVRRAVTVALRRWGDARIARMLADPEPTIAAEAARAIYDVPIEDAFGALAARIDAEPTADHYFGRRVLCANRYLGGAGAALKIGALAANAAASPALRTEALEILAEWQAPGPRDRIVGAWRPLGERPAEEVTPAIEAAQAGLEHWEGDERVAWARLLREHPEAAALRTLVPLLSSADDGWRVRRESLETLILARVDLGIDVLEVAVRDADGRVRARAYQELGKTDPARAIAKLREAIAAGEDAARQESVHTLAAIEAPEVEPVLRTLLASLPGSAEHDPIEVDVVAVCSERGEAFAADVTAYRERAAARTPDYADWSGTLVGGDWKNGRKIFREKAVVACLRCHAVGTDGVSEVGPNLGGIGLARTRQELLESIVFPNKVLGEGFENWILVLDDDTMVVGRIAEETPESLRVLTYENGEVGEVELDPQTVATRKKDVSPMPSDLASHLSPAEMRDLVEFLATRSDEAFVPK
ncbi:MAG: c-type cytochrome [bacterium]|nr:c-type cytochrome [bacterium]